MQRGLANDMQVGIETGRPRIRNRFIVPPLAPCAFLGKLQRNRSFLQ